MPSGGRFGYKCIPAHTTCEVYHNQSGAEASITFATQVLDANETVDVNAGIVTVATCLNCCEQVVSGFSTNTIGYYNQGTFRGVFLRGSSGVVNEQCTRPGTFINVDENGTETRYTPVNPASHEVKPYGGNEVILPGSTNLSTLTTCGAVCMALCAHPVYSCDAKFVYYVTSVNTGCKDCNLGRKIVDPYYDASGSFGGFGFDNGGQIGCNVVSTTCYYHANIVACRTNATAETSGVDICHWIINHYGNHVTGDKTCNGTPGCTYSKGCSDATKAQFPFLGIDATANSIVHAWTCGLHSSQCTAGADFFSACHSLAAHPNCFRINYASTSTFWTQICTLTGLGTLNSSCWCNNSSSKSPYGVQRAATYGAFTWAFCNSETATGYFFGYPYTEKPLGHCCGTTACNSTQTSGIGVWVNIGTVNSCEFPIKYLSHDPNTCKTYLMSRSDNINNCGIFEVNYNLLQQAHQTNCGNSQICNANILPLPSLTWTTGFEEESDTQLNYFTKVADFPQEMTAPAYEFTGGQMCVSCIYKYGPSNWALQIANNTTSGWDTFTSCNLIDWKKDNNISLFLNESQKIYKCSDECIVNFSDQFDTNVPECAIIDYGVRSNAYERSGIVISDGDRLVINNDGEYPISAQVWGFEG